MKSFLIASFAAVALGCGAVAQEQAALSFDRAMLATEAGAADVMHDVHDVVHTVCAAEHYPGVFMRAMRSCMRDTMARTVAAINAPTLTTLYMAELTPRQQRRFARRMRRWARAEGAARRA